MYEVNKWKHVFKLDPNKPMSDEALEEICQSGTDAIIVGGTDDVTEDNVLFLLSRIRRFLVPCVLEVSNLDALVPGFDLYFIPTVLNSQVTQWVTGHHHQAVKEYGQIMNWDEIVMEGYCIANPDCKAANLTNAKEDLTIEDIEAYAIMAEKMFRLPIFYLEYSGRYGDIEVVKQVKHSLDQTTLFYGGGIKNLQQAEEMAQFADVIVVGNALYENLEEALETVKILK
ncbi:heptaprenylglyceryl phosphate synthase [Bacillus carboniphilus]|uniref:Heptaprenylglyceryl phosphate synthase n=1 Tax=Bacillus carboniphilus TaxID=86663 RepID=A0ABY9JUV0_9BACI|nr:heptaprenylglyceryl phosphate synthase [Bacillus carboniphilus]WLR42268.1 heptaprenylglyceryl phosphate synthase [Bacillus carboniphilus]